MPHLFERLGNDENEKAGSGRGLSRHRETTLLGMAAQQLTQQGHRVALITNDQAPGLVDTGIFKQAGWTVPENSRDIAQHLEIQVVGVGVLVRGPAASDPGKPPPSGYVVLTPLLKTIQAAFRTVGIEVQFINWHPKNSETPEVVIGSKPEPKSN